MFLVIGGHCRVLGDCQVLRDSDLRTPSHGYPLKKARTHEEMKLQRQVTYHKKVGQKLRTELRDAKKKTDDALMDTQKVRKELGQVQGEIAERDVVIESLTAARKEDKRCIHALKQKIWRIPDRLATVMCRAARVFSSSKSIEPAAAFYLKSKDSKSAPVPDAVRDAITDLVACDGVPATKVVQVFKRMSAVFGVQLQIVEAVNYDTIWSIFAQLQERLEQDVQQKEWEQVQVATEFLNLEANFEQDLHLVHRMQR
ncbi:hypothetical protein GGX14DRAFT_397515 [Mycena pura]|uniref:Uncharacterized protein n=1 Tax=Mycena pura TaxID=153505 RepID=A0AAD6VCC1_9AGAR|nr:hypothetical protein GGX14DRAFT_397515 [Mycena pura]